MIIIYLCFYAITNTLYFSGLLFMIYPFIFSSLLHSFEKTISKTFNEGISIMTDIQRHIFTSTYLSIINHYIIGIIAFTMIQNSIETKNTIIYIILLIQFIIIITYLTIFLFVSIIFLTISDIIYTIDLKERYQPIHNPYEIFQFMFYIRSLSIYLSFNIVPVKLFIHNINLKFRNIHHHNLIHIVNHYNYCQNSEEKECSICLEMVINETVYDLPCKHIFHKPCLQEWFKTNSTCPLCRSYL